MAVTTKWYGKAMLNALAGSAKWLAGGTPTVALCGTAYTPDQDAHDFFNDITGEITATGYTAGGSVLANPTLTYTGATNVLKLDADDLNWPAFTGTAHYAVVYDASPGTAPSNPLFCYVDFGEDKVASGGAFTITWGTAGIATVTVG